MIEGATALFRKQGYTGTGFREVIAQTGAPRGSIYHHFPGGKAELAHEVIRHYTEQFSAYVAAAVRGGDPLAVFGAYMGFVRQSLEQSNFSAGCPVVAIVVDSPGRPDLVQAADVALSTMGGTLARALRGAGVPRARAATLSTLAVAGIEGAVVLCRAAHDTEALDAVRVEVEGALRAALGDAAAPAR
jgi:AcrR family transcriptional regulator